MDEATMRAYFQTIIDQNDDIRSSLVTLLNRVIAIENSLDWQTQGTFANRVAIELGEIKRAVDEIGP